MHRLAIASPFAPLDFWAMVRALGRATSEEVQRIGAHLVHAHWWVPGGVAARRAERHGRPYMVTMHGTDVALAMRLPFGRRMMASVLRDASTVTAVSTFLADEACLALGISRGSVPVTPMPLALGVTADPDTPRSGVIFVGRLTRQKNVNVLLEALALLRRDGLPLELTIVGDGPERANLKAQAIALGVRATFVGFVPPDQVGGYLRDKRVFVLPSVREGLGLAVAEALTQGVPVVATRSGGIPDLVTDPDAGLLVPPNDPAALAFAIRAVAGEERFRVGALRAGRQLAERLSPEHVAEQFEMLYQRARGSRASLAAVRA
jgi:glycosyltransferase involved in cell wall biosynthesis